MFRKALALLLPSLLLAGCTEMMVLDHIWKKGDKGSRQCVPVGKGAHKVGTPYTIDGKRYAPLKTSAGFKEEGIASWYGSDFHGRPTANGECYDMYGISAAHRYLPIPTDVRVTNLQNGKSIVVRVNDRGPYAKNRVIDLSYGAAQQLGYVKNGVTPIRVEAIGGPHHGTAVAQAQQGYTLTRPGVAELPPPPQTHPVTSRAPLAGGVQLYVQTGAFGTRENAQRQYMLVKRTFSNVRVAEKESLFSQTLHRVQVGPFSTVAEADAALADLTNSGFNEAIITVQKPQ
ncbi:MAG: septal ring lytic transglycosylase RlpA family protein [Alphaproteobacteria bacterium]